jgi:hypothetical protein
MDCYCRRSSTNVRRINLRRTQRTLSGEKDRDERGRASRAHLECVVQVSCFINDTSLMIRHNNKSAACDWCMAYRRR